MTGNGLHTTPKAAFRSIRVAYARPITVLLACVVLLSTTSSDRLMAHISLVPSFYSIALCVAISILLLPARWAGLGGLPLATGVMYGLAWLSELKTMAIGMPFTALDVEILFTDPSIVANALGAPFVTGPSVTTGLCLIGMAVSFGVFRQRGRISPVFGLVSVVTLIVALGIGATCLKRYALFAHHHARSLAYGFDEFVGGRALGLPDDWATIVDRDIAAAVIAHGAFEHPGPFFYLINTNENHGPHPCRSDRTASSFSVTFQRGASQEQTCAFHEYLRRARSTSDAFEMVAEALKAIELETGRPYVLLAYGDHQPWSFTDGLYSVAGGVAADSGVGDFSALRTAATGYMTFFHLQASGTAVLKQQRFAEPPPAVRGSLFTKAVR